MTSEMISQDQVPEEFRVPKGGWGPVYHSTAPDSRGGRGRFLTGPVVHVGTPVAAQQRASFEADPGDPYERATSMELYEGVIRTGSSVAPLTEDYVANVASGTRGYPPNNPAMPTRLKNQIEEISGKYDVYPYVNEAEDIGSLSYAVRPGALRNVRPVKGGPDLAGDRPATPPRLVRPGDVLKAQQERRKIRQRHSDLETES